MLRRVSLALVFISLPAGAQQPALTSRQIARIDSIFAAYAFSDVPGCAVGVSRRDTVVFERGWGSADLEHPDPITPATIFEGGSVTKQFTAGAVLRLAQQGKLSLDDDIRKYLPEIPAYDAPITINHLIHHTSGLRDWGDIMGIAGWPRGTRTYTQAHVLDIVARQPSLNYPVGAEYLYSNSNYNLLAMIAERVSGKTLAEFTKVEFFEPLGMTSSGWRDDYKRVVPRRAQAYSGRGKEWRLDMPFENVYGNSSLLTTVGDLLKWDANFGHKKVGGDAFVTMQTTKGMLKSGREISYAVGMVMGSFQGTPEISHTGATASYRAFLARYPDAGYAVALLCNAGSVDPGVLGRAVSTVVLPLYKAPVAAARDTIGMSFAVARLAPMIGYYRHSLTDAPLHLAAVNGRIVNVDGQRLVGMSERHYRSVSGRTHFELEAVRAGRGRIRTWVDDADTTFYVPVDAPRPAVSFGEYAGSFYSEEADAATSILVENGKLVLFERPSAKVHLAPIYADGFNAEGSYVKFVRDSDGHVNGFLVTTGRARNVRFDRVKTRTGTRP